MMDYFVRMANEGQPFREAFILDCHGHFGTEVGFHIPGADTREYIAVLDRIGIDMVAVSTFSSVFPFGNDIIAEAVSACPGRFVGYARVNANYPEDIDSELSRCFDELGFKGIKIHPYCDQVFPQDPRYDSVWEFASERSVPVLVHTWNSLRYTDPLLDCCIPTQFRTIAEEYPRAKIILGHSGGEYDGIIEAISVAKVCPNVYLDTASSRLYPDVIEMMVAEVGAERVLYGSDVPFLSPVPQVGKVVYADITESEKRMILGLNAARLFGIDVGN
ncbi:MAG: amidohydrolase family protein [Planctomycetota bacterium]